MATNIKAGLHKIKMNALSCAEINLPCRPKWTFPTWILTSSVWIWLLHTLTLMHTLTLLHTLKPDADSHTADSQARWESDNDRVQRRPLYPAFFSTIFKIGELPYLPDICSPYLSFSYLNFHICPIFVFRIYLPVTSTSIFARYLFSVFIFQGERSMHVAWLTDNDTEVQCFCIFLQFVWKIRILMKKWDIIGIIIKLLWNANPLDGRQNQHLWSRQWMKIRNVYIFNQMCTIFPMQSLKYFMTNQLCGLISIMNMNKFEKFHIFLWILIKINGPQVEVPALIFMDLVQG